MDINKPVRYNPETKEIENVELGLNAEEEAMALDTIAREEAEESLDVAEKLENHDCHASPEDSCPCQKFRPIDLSNDDERHEAYQANTD